MIKILVTGASGQLGSCLQKIAPTFKTCQFYFKNSGELDILNKKLVNSLFEKDKFDYCINCAAYTNVELAEKEPEKAFKVNAEGARNIALACKKSQTGLVHLSTDYVFDGEKQGPYTIHDIPNPVNEYGKSKLLGEQYIKEVFANFLIIRTSWLYSEFGKNFYKTIIEKSKTEKILRVTDEQIGCPTNANNLAMHIVKKLTEKNINYGIEHFTDGYSSTWFDFAKKIVKDQNLQDKVQLVKDRNYCTFVKRPINSVLI
ncbi:dTDP-4-dehydrorhamnose reductase [Maribacter hydrothermalis]|uniref:dTDP-4-dehydrorhamnose reductase n=1 Tax=Maribacter hydrothermalis TaxID=1836467 RepID=A0A1B7ZE31_9FLAO|nr:dTDP-4-dehydrorhamnose reductase [Maribacter hydrothermalis]APQ17349.1 dTDP-4-dehydrorhamnose reductase [Maribacter hydrothermalis]OBR41827.1 dTDP-4-dehydrorhamnose reductase [Maribacter hydrothermalis]